MGADATKGGQGHTETAAAAQTDATKGAATTETGKSAATTETTTAAKVETKADATTETGAKVESTTEKGKGATEIKTDGPPEKYSIVVSDAGKVHFDDEDLKLIETNARAAGLTNDDAQAYVDEHVAAAVAASAKFLDTTKADKDYGGDKLEETQRLSKVAIDLIRPPGHPRRESFIRFLNKVGAGNHIEAISFLADLGKRASEDTATGGSGAQKAAKTAEDVLYGGTR